MTKPMWQRVQDREIRRIRRSLRWQIFLCDLRGLYWKARLLCIQCRVRWVELRMQLAPAPTGALEGTSGVLADVTDLEVVEARGCSPPGGDSSTWSFWYSSTANDCQRRRYQPACLISSETM